MSSGSGGSEAALNVLTRRTPIDVGAARISRADLTRERPPPRSREQRLSRPPARRVEASRRTKLSFARDNRTRESCSATSGSSPVGIALSGTSRAMNSMSLAPAIDLALATMISA
jgi:hypothetical protein